MGPHVGACAPLLGANGWAPIRGILKMLHQYRVHSIVYTLHNASGPLDVSLLPFIKDGSRFYPGVALQVPSKNIRILAFHSGKVVIVVRNPLSFAYTGPVPWPFPFIDFRLVASVVHYGPCAFETTFVRQTVLGCKIQGIGPLSATKHVPDPSKGDNNDRVPRHVLISGIMNELHAQQVIGAFLALH